jgi:hypothetical protein
VTDLLLSIYLWNGNDKDLTDFNPLNSLNLSFGKNEAEKRTLFVLHLEERLQLKNVDEWMDVSTAEVVKNGGRGWLQYYGGSLVNGMMSVLIEL